MARSETYLLTIDNHALRFAGKVIPLRSIAYFEKLVRKRRVSVWGLVIPLVLAGGLTFAGLLLGYAVTFPQIAVLTLVLVLVMQALTWLTRKNEFALIVQTSAGDKPELFTTTGEHFLDALLAELTLRLEDREDLPPLIANIHNKTIKEGDVIMGDKVGADKVGGDKFENVTGTIINRSTLENSMNTVAQRVDEETAQALDRIAALIEEQNNHAAAAVFKEFTEELEKPDPAKDLLKSLWDGLKAIMPVLGAATDITVKIAKLFD